MPLKACRECGHQVSTDAAKCPQCGAVLKEGILNVMMPRKKDSPVEINWGLRITIALAVLTLMLIVWFVSQR